MTEIDTTLLLKTFRAALTRPGISEEAKRKASLVIVALEQWPFKSEEDQAKERQFIERDIAELQALISG
jgi:hypothetical protein